MTDYFKRSVVCVLCGAKLRRNRPHMCTTPNVGPVDENALLEEIRAIQPENRAHMARLKAAGVIGTHPTRRRTGPPHRDIVQTPGVPSTPAPALNHRARKSGVLMAKARIELHKDGDRMAIVTNATDEHDFWESFCELLGTLIDEDITAPMSADGEMSSGIHYGGDWEFQLRYWLPQATEIICKLRGYKTANVHEERVLVSGSANPHHKVHEIGPSDLTMPPSPVEEAVAA